MASNIFLSLMQREGEPAGGANLASRAPAVYSSSVLPCQKFLLLDCSPGGSSVLGGSTWGSKCKGQSVIIIIKIGMSRFGVWHVLVYCL